MTTPPDVWPPQSDSPWAPVPPAPVSEGRDGFAVVALVLGIVPVLGGVLGVVFGILGFRRAGRTGQKGRAMAAWGAGFGALWLLGIGSALVVGAVLGPRAWNETGSVALSDLRVGDCVEDIPTTATRTLEVVACTTAHRGEVFDVHQFAEGEFSGEQEVDRFSEGRCTSALHPYVGLPRGVVSGYTSTYFSPTADDWAVGDRHVQCLLERSDRALMTSSARGAGGGAPQSPRPTSRVRPGQASGDVLFSRLRVGDCVAEAPVEQILTFPVVPCARRHLAEVYAVTSLKAAPFPGEPEVIRLAEGYCAKRLPAYLGLPTGANDGYDLYYLYPTDRNWSVGARRVTCMLQAPHERPLMGSARGKGRYRA